MIADIRASSKLSVFLSADSFVFREVSRSPSGRDRIVKYYLSDRKPLSDWKSKDLFDHFWKHDILPTNQAVIDVTLGDVVHTFKSQKHISKLSNEVLIIENITSLEGVVSYQIPTAISCFFEEIKNAKTSFSILNIQLMKILVKKGVNEFTLFHQIHETLYIICLKNGRIEVSNFFRVGGPMDVIYYFKLMQDYISATLNGPKVIIGGELENQESLKQLCKDFLGDHSKFSSYLTDIEAKSMPFNL